VRVVEHYPGGAVRRARVHADTFVTISRSAPPAR
jgi:hypothetical protein